MLCEKCGKNQATHSYLQNINGKETSVYLCSECAKKYAYGDLFSSFPFNFSNLLSSFFDTSLLHAPVETDNTLRCEKCGTSYNEIVENGQIGCAQCYTTFSKQLRPVIEKIHGVTEHKGKVPNSAGESLKQKHRLSNLKKQLTECIAKQEFEKAAQLRDEISALEKEAGGNE